MSFSDDFQCVINTTSTFSSNSSTLSRLSPITETIPIPLIPVCNRPLVYYQLDLVVKSNFSDVVLIVDEKYAKKVMIKVEEYIKENKLSGSFEVEYVVLVERSRGDGDVEVLRELGKRKNEKKETLLKKDFFLIGCDVIAGHILYDLADAHRKYDASVALAYSGPPSRENNNNKKKKTNKQKISDKTKKKPKKSSEYVGLARKSISCSKDVTCARVVYSKLKDSFKDEEKLVLPKALLAKCPDISMRSDLHSLNVYLFKRWILDLVRKKEEFRSIKDHLIPFLVNRDGRTLEDPSLKITSPVRRQISSDTVLEEEDSWEETERFKVFSVIFPADMNVFGGRANSIKSYLSLSMDLMGDEVKSTKSESSDLVDKTQRPWPLIKKGFNRFFQSKEDAPEKKLWKKLRGFIAAELPNERPKGTNCVIGKSVVLGKNVKLSNSILMDGVKIEDDCT